MTWARAGCYVLVPDLIGYGERLHTPYPGRQSYFFRYDLGMQFALCGESLIGRYVGDLQRGVDVLLAQDNADPARVILLGAVAGGGDPAAVTAALDSRITCVAPFNFGGPQPESVVDDASAAAGFRYTGSGGWESTRNLRLSARDGFLPWTIVGAAVPRALVYAHEFEWHADLDPVWARLRDVYKWHGVSDRLGSLKGTGRVSQRPPEATHCNQIGAYHRAQLYPLFERWFGMKPPRSEYTAVREPEELNVLPENSTRMPAQLQARVRAEARIAEAIQALAACESDARRSYLRERYTQVLGLPEHGIPVLRLAPAATWRGSTPVERLIVETEPGIEVPLLLLRPREASGGPLVVAFAQEGKARILRERGGSIAHLLERGATVCLPDLRGFGETAPDEDRSWYGPATKHASSELMLGRTQLGNRLFDLRAVLMALRAQKIAEWNAVMIWGDSFARLNPPGFESPPHRGGTRSPDTQGPPIPPAAIGEPGAGFLALLAALFEPQVRAVHATRTLISWLDTLRTPFVHLPFDAIVPGIVHAGDVPELVATLAPSDVYFEGPIDGRNLLLNPTDAKARLASSGTTVHVLPDLTGPELVAWIET